MVVNCEMDETVQTMQQQSLPSTYACAVRRISWGVEVGSRAYGDIRGNLSDHS